MAEEAAEQVPVVPDPAVSASDDAPAETQAAGGIDGQVPSEAQDATAVLVDDAPDAEAPDVLPPGSSDMTEEKGMPGTAPRTEGIAASAADARQATEAEDGRTEETPPAASETVSKDSEPAGDPAQEPASAPLASSTVAAEPLSVPDASASSTRESASLSGDGLPSADPAATAMASEGDGTDEAWETPLQATAAPVAAASSPLPASPQAQDPLSTTEAASPDDGTPPLPAADSSEGAGTEAESRSFQSPADRQTGAIANGLAPAEAVEASASPAPSPVAAPPATGGPLPQYMRPAALADNLDRIVLHSVRSDPHSIRIELEPASLGRVLVHCRETSAGLNVEIAVQSGQIRSLLVAQEQELRLNLESQGVHMGRFSVTCRDDEGRPDGDRAGQRHQDREATEAEERHIGSEPAPGAAPDGGRGMRIGSRNRWVA